MKPKYCAWKNCSKPVKGLQKRYCCAAHQKLAEQEPIPREERRRNIWTPERDEMLYQNWGRWTAAGVTSDLNEKTGAKFTIQAVRVRAAQLGLNAYSNQGALCINDAGREVGASGAAVAWFLARNGFKAVSNGKIRMVPDEAIEPMRAYFAPLTEDAVGTAAAARELGYCRDHLHRLIERGRLRAIKHRGRLYVPRAEITRIKLDRLRAG